MSDAMNIFELQCECKKPSYLDYLIEFAKLNDLNVLVNEPPEIYHKKYRIDLASKTGNRIEVKEGIMLKGQVYSGNTLEEAAKMLLDDIYKKIIVVRGLSCEDRTDISCTLPYYKILFPN